jgi:hypothetical protein
MPSSLYSRIESRRILIRRHPVPHHTRRHRPDDANSPCRLCVSFQPGNPYSKAQIFELFLPTSAQFPSTNPPYPSSMFSTKGNKVISSLCALLGYYSDQWVDEPILGFLSIFSTDENPTTQFDSSTFLAENIHEQFVNFGTEGMFRYSSILAYMFVYFQADKFSFSMQKMDADGRPQAVTTWTSLLKHNSTEYSFKAFIDLFYHPMVSMLSGRPEPRINDEF